MSERPQVAIYTDGACDPNPGPGGWAALLISGPREKEIFGAEPDTTNNQMELRAVIEALNALKRPADVTIKSDSKYVRKGITEWIDKWKRNGWQTSAKEPVKNRELWQALDAARAIHNIDWQWVKGHAGNPRNERVDRLAVAQIPRPEPSDDHEAAIYVGVSCQQRQGRGAWVALVRVGDELVERSGTLRQKATANNLLIMAAFEGLQILPLNLVTRVFTSADYLQKGATEWMAGWKQRGWKTKDGKNVKNAAEWQQLAAQMELRTVSFFNPKGNHPPTLTEAGERAEELMRALS